jgi:hypothetical protein
MGLILLGMGALRASSKSCTAENAECAEKFFLFFA